MISAVLPPAEEDDAPCTTKASSEFAKRYTPEDLTWNLKTDLWKKMFIYNPVIFRFHVNLPGRKFGQNCVNPVGRVTGCDIKR